MKIRVQVGVFSNPGLQACSRLSSKAAWLGNCDLAALLGAADSYIAAVLTEHERKTQ